MVTINNRALSPHFVPILVPVAFPAIAPYSIQAMSVHHVTWILFSLPNGLPIPSTIVHPTHKNRKEPTIRKGERI